MIRNLDNTTVTAIFEDCLESRSLILSLGNSDFTANDKGKYVCTGIQANDNPNYRVGKLVQIRQGTGAFGTEQVLLRHPDNTLVVHENQAFWLISKKYHELLDELFSNTEQDDADSFSYRDCDGVEKLGFIVDET